MRKRKPSGNNNTQTITLVKSVFTEVEEKKVKKFWDLAIKFSLEQFPEDAWIYRAMSYDTFLKKYFTSAEWQFADCDVESFIDDMFDAYADTSYATRKKR